MEKSRNKSEKSYTLVLTNDIRINSFTVVTIIRSNVTLNSGIPETGRSFLISNKPALGSCYRFG